MTAKESKAVAWITPRGLECLNKCRNDHDIGYTEAWTRSDEEKTVALVEESALHAAEAELGELRRKVGEVLRDGAGWIPTTYADKLRLLLASDGGADGDNEGEGK